MQENKDKKRKVKGKSQTRRDKKLGLGNLVARCVKDNNDLQFGSSIE